MNSFGRPTERLSLLTGSLPLPVTIRSSAAAAAPCRGPTTQFPLANGGRIAGGAGGGGGGAGKSEGGGGAADDIYFPNQSNDEAAAVALPLSRFARRHGQFINDSPSVEARHSSNSKNCRFKEILSNLLRNNDYAILLASFAKCIFEALQAENFCTTLA